MIEDRFNFFWEKKRFFLLVLIFNFFLGLNEYEVIICLWFIIRFNGLA